MEQKIRRLVERCADITGSNLALATYLGTHERTVYRWLSAETRPNAENIIEMYELVLSKKKHIA